jgi:hypothetical protein
MRAKPGHDQARLGKDENTQIKISFIVLRRYHQKMAHLLGFAMLPHFEDQHYL